MVWILSLFLSVMSVSLARAEIWVTIVERPGDTLWVDVDGPITKRDGDDFEAVIRESLKNSTLYVRLSSEGGDVYAVMQIGRAIRKYEGTTIILDKSKCYSSCALIFIAGVVRHNLGELGLHRPYLASVPQDRKIIEKQYPQLLALVKKYVSEMGITESFYHQMVNTEPSKMAIYRVLDYANLVPEEDPTYQEVRVAYSARLHGLTTLEMRQRDQDAQECLKRTTAEIPDCSEALRWGLSERVYRERQSRTKECQLADADSQLLQGLPRNQQRDHPIALKHEACVRKIMLAQ